MEMFLAIAIMQIGDERPFTECTTIVSDKVNIHDVEAVIKVFSENPLTQLVVRPKRVLLIRNNPGGSPYVVQDWG